MLISDRWLSEAKSRKGWKFSKLIWETQKLLQTLEHFQHSDDAIRECFQASGARLGGRAAVVMSNHRLPPWRSDSVSINGCRDLRAEPSVKHEQNQGGDDERRWSLMWEASGAGGRKGRQTLLTRRPEDEELWSNKVNMKSKWKDAGPGGAGGGQEVKTHPERPKHFVTFLQIHVQVP